ncbi:MAG: hypothetical protein O2960_19755 [Verrucomicrobia bacterium]|nr:hypothetical protein [Verrucomicrobiota bacterium]
MKRNRLFVVAALILSTSVLWVISQQAPAPSQRPASPPLPNAGDLPILLVDRTTWMVTDPQNRGIDLSAANSLERRTERWKTVLAFEFPDEFQRRFPSAPEESKLAQSAADAIENPKSLSAFMNEARSFEEQKSLERSIDSFLNPGLFPRNGAQ